MSEESAVIVLCDNRANHEDNQVHHLAQMIVTIVSTGTSTTRTLEVVGIPNSTEVQDRLTPQRKLPEPKSGPWRDSIHSAKRVLEADRIRKRVVIACSECGLKADMNADTALWVAEKWRHADTPLPLSTLTHILGTESNTSHR